jgi:phosphoenolpyruvate synthase/pyruvate phosphate dikinase
LSHKTVNISVCISGLPVTIRLLDPPLHEFLPEGHVEDIVRELCSETGAAEDDVLARMEKLSEVNPMLGFRGCRLAFVCPTACLVIEEIGLFFIQHNISICVIFS